MDPPISLDTLEFPHFRVGQIAILLNEFHGFLMEPSLLLNEFNVLCWIMLIYVDLCCFMLIYVDLCWFTSIWLQAIRPSFTPCIYCLHPKPAMMLDLSVSLKFSQFRNWVFWIQEWIFLNYIIPELSFVNSWMEFLFGRGGGGD